MEPRALTFRDFDEVLTEVDRLRDGGYDRAGQWSLGQVCAHLSYYLRGSLDGFGFRLPWIVRVLFGRPLRRRLLGDARMRSGQNTIPASRPAPELDESRAVDEFRALVERFQKAPGPFPPSPLLGDLSRDEWQRLHLTHCAHHFGFLIPKPHA